ncbi:MAG TPA: bifunctional phosphoribosylaminoimidazolecarboxamide formyltransferase/IMP cyclohydrolase [Vicinamibacterales bacterium]
MRAILSVSDKTGLIDFARGLAARGVQLVSTGGTSKALADAGLPVTNVSDVTGFPEMMDGRVKTLHPKIHGGILARRHRPDDLAAIEAQGIDLVDLVVVNLYPFAKAAANPETPFDELVEQIDIGGPSLLRAAGKNFRDVTVVVDPADYPRVLEQMARPGGPSLEFKFELMTKAFAHTAQFDALIAGTLQTIRCEGDTFLRGPQGGRPGVQTRPLRYGENPHQKATWVQGHGPNWAVRWETHQGKELSYTNLLDLDAAARIALEFTEPAAVVIKHTNPCGTATGATIAEAYVRAREADPLSAFGGIVGLNREIDVETAKALTSTFIEAVIAPSVAADARPVLATKQNLRVVTADFAAMANLPTLMGSGEHAAGTEIRSFLGGMLHQEPDRVVEARNPWPPPSRPESGAASAGPGPSGSGAEGSGPEGQIRVVTKRQPTAEEWTALRFAWRVCAHVKSNTIVFTGADRTLAVGAGQMSRVDSVKVAVMKAAPGSLQGSVAASDAFFPFRDGLDAIADAGATAVVQPGGSVRDAEVIAAADQRGLAMVFTGRRHFRH